MSRQFWISMVTEAVRSPRTNALRLLGLPLPGAALYEALVAVAILSSLSVYLVAGLAGVPVLSNSPLPPPVLMAVLQVLVMTLLAGAIVGIGRLFGGQATLEGALRVIIWLQVLMLVMQVLQLVFIAILPPVAGIVSLVAMVVIFWVAAGLIAGLQGFRSIFLTLVGMLLGLIVLALAISILISPFLPAVV